MPARRILQLGDPVLREISAPVPDPPRESLLLSDLRSTLHEFQRTHGFGRGISAVQIGEPKRLLYLELGGRSYAMFNPQYVHKSAATFQMWDDCFSFPNLMVWLDRNEAVRVRYQDETGRLEEIDASGDLSELLQHEIDHLDGILAVDRAVDRESLITREEWLRQGARKLERGTRTPA
jgi:peptide deformylase